MYPERNGIAASKAVKSNPAKLYIFTLPGKSRRRICCSLEEMLEILRQRCPGGKLRELQTR